MERFDDQFSVDDILNEVRQHHSGGGSNAPKTDADQLIEEILKEQAAKKETGGPVPAAVQSKEEQPFQIQIPEDPPAAPSVKQPDMRPTALQNETGELPPMMRKMERRYFTDPEEESQKPQVQPDEPTEYTYHPSGGTGPVPDEEVYLKLRENRKKKIKDFVLLGEEEEVDDADADTDDEEDGDKVSDEFESMADAPSVLEDLKELSASISIRFVLLLILFILNLYPVLANVFSVLPLPHLLRAGENPMFYSLVSLIILLVAAIVSHTTVLGGLLNFCKLKADGDSLPALAVLASAVECVVFLLFPEAIGTQGVQLYSFAAVTGLLFNCMGKMLIVKRTMLNFKYVTADCDKYATEVIADEHLANDLTKGVLTNLPVTVTNRKTGFLTGFLDMSFQEDIYDSVCKWLARFVFLAAAALAAGGYAVTKNAYITLTAVVGVLAVSSSLFGLFTVNLPVLKAVKSVHKHGGMIIGYPAAEEFCDINSATAEGSDLFPAGSVVLHGIKTFKNGRIDDAILDAASILVKANSILSDVFMQVIQGKPELLKEVDTIVYEDSMGISGWVDNKRVLIGSRDLMLNHGIDVPSKDYEKRYCGEHNNNIIYLSASGELTAVFIVSLRAAQSVAAALERLEKNDVFLIVKTVDAILTKEKLAEVFQVEPALFRVIPSRLHKPYDEAHAPVERAEGFLANNGKFYSYVKTLTVAKRLKTRIMLGLVVTLASVIIGVGMIAALLFLGGMAKITVLFLIAYQLLWFAVAWLVQKFRAL